MGAQEFETIGHGSTVQEAFGNAKEEAFYEYGHSGYTGTIAEKNSFSIIPCGMTPREVQSKMDACMQDYNHFTQNKWGAAGAIKLSKNTWLFFGCASS